MYKIKKQELNYSEDSPTFQILRIIGSETPGLPDQHKKLVQFSEKNGLNLLGYTNRLDQFAP